MNYFTDRINKMFPKNTSPESNNKILNFHLIEGEFYLSKITKPTYQSEFRKPKPEKNLSNIISQDFNQNRIDGHSVLHSTFEKSSSLNNLIDLNTQKGLLKYKGIYLDTDLEGNKIFSSKIIFYIINYNERFNCLHVKIKTKNTNFKQNFRKYEDPKT